MARRIQYAIGTLLCMTASGALAADARTPQPAVAPVSALEERARQRVNATPRASLPPESSEAGAAG